MHFEIRCTNFPDNLVYRKKITNEFEQDYDIYTPIWWYIRSSFIFELINQVLQPQKIHGIIKTRFFIRDPHKQIKRLHKYPSKELTLLRGQGLS